MKKYLVFLYLCLLVGIQSVEAQKYRYSVLNIADSLLKNARAVKRVEELSIRHISPGKAIVKHHYAITIFNESADRYADFYEYYNGFHDIISIDGALYNALGEKLKSVKKKDIEDQSSVGGAMEVSDTRYKYHRFYFKEYPYTIEYDTEVEMNGIFGLPGLSFQSSFGESVESSMLIVQASENYQIRHKLYNLPDTFPKPSKTGSIQTYRWEVKNLKAVKWEPYAPQLSSFMPRVSIAPTSFEIDGFRGDMTNWKTFGLFRKQLYQGRDELPLNIKQEVKNLTANLKTDREKVNALYEFMQRNTRYISVQLGIGGWRPFDAQYVAKNGYGDCKALSNYMVALLKEVGIKGQYIIIKSGDYDFESMDKDFVSNQFDHVIACVPLGKDTVWLECTSQTLPPGYLSAFTANRPALMVTENGGELVQTPNYNTEQNLKEHKIQATLAENGQLTMQVHSAYRGIEQDDLHARINGLTRDKLMTMLRNQLEIPNYDIKDFNYKEEKSSLPTIRETLHIEADNYASISGKRIFIAPNIINRHGDQFKIDSVRRLPLQLYFGSTETDSVEIALPTGYKPEYIPKEIKLVNAFGEYHSRVEVKDNRLVYYRKKITNAGRFDASEAAALSNYFNTIYKADRNRVVLVKAE